MTFHVKIRLEISCGSSAKQTIHMKFQVFLSQKKEKKNNIKVLSAVVGIKILRVMEGNTREYLL